MPPIECPRLSASRENAEPMNPVAPVTRIFMQNAKLLRLHNDCPAKRDLRPGTLIFGHLRNSPGGSYEYCPIGRNFRIYSRLNPIG